MSDDSERQEVEAVLLQSRGDVNLAADTLQMRQERQERRARYADRQYLDGAAEATQRRLEESRAERRRLEADEAWRQDEEAMAEQTNYLAQPDRPRLTMLTYEQRLRA